MSARPAERTPDRLRLEVGPELAGLDAQSALTDALWDVPTGEVRRLFAAGAVTRGGARCAPDAPLAPGEVLEVDAADAERIAVATLPGFALLHAGARLLACQKPAGVAVDADRGGDARPLLGAILEALLALGRRPPPRARLAHRLDKGTTGVLLVALDRAALADVGAQLEARAVEKEYLALVVGAPRAREGVVELPLSPPLGGGPARVDEREGKPARTRWRVEEAFRRHALLRAFPETGRTHQVRAHLAALGHPLVGDPLYGGPERLLLSQLKRGYRPSRDREEPPLLARTGLHAERVRLREPGGGPLEVVAPLAPDLALALKQLRRHDPAR